ncbi:MAG: DNA primase [Microcoleaceae cyanobacterium]
MSIPRIHPDTIEDVKQRADIYDIVAEKVVLKKRGKDYVGLCPFHEEKSPSFTVSPSKQMYYCFGCGAGGNAIKFMMELDKSSFSDVVLNLARRYQVPVKTEAPEARQEFQRQLSLREQLYEILAIATSFYQHALNQPTGEVALAYLKSERQLSTETIQTFQLGYAPKGWEALYDYLVEQKHFPLDLVEQAGLILPRKTGGGYYDRFRDRLMIPIQDLQGRVIGFGGRTLGDEQPKYLNSPETELFDKGKTLFALDKAKTAIARLDQAIVVEGYFDAIALHAAGAENVVASLGTALSLDQVRQLLRYTESKLIILNFDADAAGTQAAQRAIGELEVLAYSGVVQLRVLNLPEGKDADDFLRAHSIADYQTLTKNAVLWLDWQIDQTVKGRDLTKVVEGQKVAHAMGELLSKLRDGIQRTQYIQRCAEILSQGESSLIAPMARTLRNQVNKLISKAIHNSNSSPSLPANSAALVNSESDSSLEIELPVAAERRLLEASETLILQIYLHCPEHRQLIVDALDARDLQFSLSYHRLLWRKIVELEDQQDAPKHTLNLVSKLQDVLLESNLDTATLQPLFYLDDKATLNILRAPLEVRSAIATMELVICSKRRHLALKLWKETDCAQAPQLARKYHDEFYLEDEWIQELERLRHTKFQELQNIPLGRVIEPTFHAAKRAENNYGFS